MNVCWELEVTEADFRGYRGRFSTFSDFVEKYIFEMGFLVKKL